MDFSDFVASQSLESLFYLLEANISNNNNEQIVRRIHGEVSKRIIFDYSVLTTSQWRLFDIVTDLIYQSDHVLNSPTVNNAQPSTSRASPDSLDDDGFGNLIDNLGPSTSGALPYLLGGGAGGSNAVAVPQPSTSPDLLNEKEDHHLRYITKTGECEEQARRFGVLSRKITFTFNHDDDANESSNNPISWLENAVAEILEYSTRECRPDDYVGLVIENENFPEKPVGISFRKRHQLNKDVIMNVIGAVLQSNAAFFTRDYMTLRMDRVRMSSGGVFAAVSKKCVTFDEYSASKYSIFVIENDDNNCLALALIVAKTFVDSGCNRDVINNFKTTQGKLHLKQLAAHLCAEVAVDLSRDGANYTHIQEFQKFLNEYTIVVYNDRAGKNVYFEGPRKPERKCLNLIFENNHFNVILSLTAAFSTSYFCEYCKAGYRARIKHTNCINRCSCCHESPPCSKQNQYINCSTCNRDFLGETCLLNHESTDLCSKLQKCLQCLKTFWVKEKEKGKNEHVCGFKYCSTCMSDKPVRHLCFMQPDKLNEKKNEEIKNNFLFIFFDLEATQHKPTGENTFLHEINLCVIQQCCSRCISVDELSNKCSKCGKRQYIFNGDDPVNQLLHHVSEMSKTFKVTCIAHNLRGYDGAFVLKRIFSNVSRWRPEIIRTGTKIISITCGNSIRFIDSLNYMALPLSQLPSAFKFDGVKGYFPHFFNTKTNINYIGEIPDIVFYGCNQMKPKDRTKFLEWYNEQKLNNFIFDMSTELVKYCVSDVDILRKACVKFRECFINANQVDPFLEATTIASACNLVFRRNFLKPDSIGIMPRGGYRCSDNQSEIATKWLLWESYSRNIDIAHAGINREVRLRENYLVDGYHELTNTVFEFYGCFWHGCQSCFADQTAELSDKNDALFIRYENTMARESRIKSLGYNLVTIWECDFRMQLKNNPDIQNYLNNNGIQKYLPLNPRDAFFGGRTNACKLYRASTDDEKIYYYDVCSLYPYINKYGKYPIGHPKAIHIGNEDCSKLNIETVEGLILCTVLPPFNLYHPVLPYRSNGKLIFPLCRTCCETMYQGVCNHTDVQRQFTGTYVADELRKAVSRGYQIIEFREIWEYNVTTYDKLTKTGGLFASYVDNFIKIKQECSSWPAHCITDNDKDAYIQEYFQREGVILDKDKISSNAGLRFLSKIMLNSFWGKFGQRPNLMQTQLINQPADLYKLLINPSTVVNSLTIINPETVLVTWNRIEEDIKPSKTVSVAIAAYTTAGARLELYKYLEKLDRRVLYFDTDSVIFTAKEDEWVPPKGNFLGCMTDELEEYGPGSYISEFVSGGPKNYAFKVYTPQLDKYKTVCKVKGISLNFDNSQIINFDAIKSMVLHDPERVLTVHTDRKITRNQRYDVISKTEDKRYKINVNKRRRLNDGEFDTLPYGYK